MVAEDYSIQYDERLADWRKQSSVDPGIIDTAWKMIQLALLDLRRKSTTYEYNSAYDWIFKWHDFFWSFANCCELTGLNADLISRKVSEYLDSGRKMPKIKGEVKLNK